ncbi:MAG: diguanylate cyclase [Oscillospiraceae bacterium]|nr:diguanylate cyclase [Oscillospiraceae bacterium]
MENKNTLLIVDDEKLNLKVLTHILISKYTIYTAKDGPGAIEKAREYLPDLILLDIVMPGMDGYEVLSVLKSTKETQHIPVIFISGLSSREDEERGLAYEAADYISKPFTIDVVKLRVDHQIKIVNQLRTIEKLTMTDQLTELPNRRSFDSRLELEWARGAREKSPVSILVMDLDKFKAYNDTFGHQQGDILLKAVADMFKATMKRSTDFIARWGGEEFIALLPNTDMGGALKIAEQIRKNIDSLECLTPNGTITKITISIGANSVVPSPTTSIPEFVRLADNALYEAKRVGRNKVIASR